MGQALNLKANAFQAHREGCAWLRPVINSVDNAPVAPGTSCHAPSINVAMGRTPQRQDHVDGLLCPALSSAPVRPVGLKPTGRWHAIRARFADQPHIPSHRSRTNAPAYA